jgi:hypothetical protein
MNKKDYEVYAGQWVPDVRMYAVAPEIKDDEGYGWLVLDEDMAEYYTSFLSANERLVEIAKGDI